MQEVLAKKEVLKKENVLKNLLLKFLWLPFKSGLGGFATFFSVLLFTKFFAYLIGAQDTFEIDFGDILLSSIGFVLMFLIKFLENFRDKN